MKKVVGLILIIVVVAVLAAGCIDYEERSVDEHEADLGTAVSELLNQKRTEAGIPEFKEVDIMTDSQKVLRDPTFSKNTNGVFYPNFLMMPDYGHKEEYFYVLPMGYVDGVSPRLSTVKTQQNAEIIVDDIVNLETFEADFLNKDLTKLTILLNFKNYEGFDYYLLCLGLD